MTALVDATDSQMAALADLVSSLTAADATLNAMMAARDGLLAMAGKLAVDIAQQSEHADFGDMTMRAVAAEIDQSLRVSDRTVEKRIARASSLVDVFPTVWEAQGAGRISAGHAHVIVEAGGHLTSAEDRAAYATAVLPLAEVESPNRLRPLAKRMAERFIPRTIDERHREARTRRRVWVADADDAMADFHLHGPATLVHAMMDRLSQMAHRVRTENLREAKEAAAAGIEFDPDSRTVDEIRADLVADLVLSGAPTGHESTEGLLSEIQGRVEITVPVMTLMHEASDSASSSPSPSPSSSASSRRGEKPGEPVLPPALLDGVVPIDADTARAFAGAASGWDRVLTHPITGALLAVDRYRPSDQLRRHLRVRDQRCRFPTCGLRARKCDLDHTEDAAAGGATSECNLGAFCRRHHTLKHASPWHVEQSAGGVITWTSPTGRTYIDEPPPPNTVVFAPSEPPSFDVRVPFETLVGSMSAPF